MFCAFLTYLFSFSSCILFIWQFLNLTTAREGGLHMASIKDVAAAAGVSTATVSRVMNNTKYVSEDIRVRVEAAIAALNYSTSDLAKNLKTAKSNQIAVIMTSLSRTFFGQVIDGIDKKAAEYGYSVVFAETNDNLETEKKMVETFARRWVDGIILATSANPETVDREYISRLGSLFKQDTRIPVVTLEVSVDNELVDSVGINQLQAACDATAYLLSIGRKFIGHISHPRHNYIGDLRVAGYRKALRDAGMPEPRGYPVPAHYTTHSGYLAMQELLTRVPQLDAVYCANDQIAIGAIKYCAEHGISVPDDIAIFGTDDIFAASIVSPPLSTVSVPKFEMGSAAVELIHCRLTDPEFSSRQAVLLPYELTIRESTDKKANSSLRYLQW